MRQKKKKSSKEALSLFFLCASISILTWIELKKKKKRRGILLLLSILQNFFFLSVEGLLPKKPRASAHIHHVDSNRPSVYTINRRYIYIYRSRLHLVYLFLNENLFHPFPNRLNCVDKTKGEPGTVLLDMTTLFLFKCNWKSVGIKLISLVSCFPFSGVVRKYRRNMANEAGRSCVMTTTTRMYLLLPLDFTTP